MGKEEDKKFLGQVFDDHYRMEVGKASDEIASAPAPRPDEVAKLQQTNKDQRAEIVRLRDIIATLTVVDGQVREDVETAEAQVSHLRGNTKLSIASLETVITALERVAERITDIPGFKFPAPEDRYPLGKDCPDWLSRPRWQNFREIQAAISTIETAIAEFSANLCQTGEKDDE